MIAEGNAETCRMIIIVLLLSVVLLLRLLYLLSVLVLFTIRIADDFRAITSMVDLEPRCSFQTAYTPITQINQ